MKRTPRINRNYESCRYAITDGKHGILYIEMAGNRVRRLYQRKNGLGNVDLPGNGPDLYRKDFIKTLN